MTTPRITRFVAVGVLAAGLAVSGPAWADGGHDRDGLGPVAFIAGLVAGAIAAPYLAAQAPRPVEYAPPPVAYAPPPAYTDAPPPPAQVVYVPAAPGYVYAAAPYTWRQGGDERPDRRRDWHRDDDR